MSQSDDLSVPALAEFLEGSAADVAEVLRRADELSERYMERIAKQVSIITRLRMTLEKAGEACTCGAVLTAVEEAAHDHTHS
jgi:hypothetical protein